jgi:hypothetical protein
VTTLRIFGSKCFIYNNKRENKASQRGEVGIFLGYSGNAQYYVEILETGALKRVDAAQVVINESVPGGTLLTGSTKGPSLSLRVGERIESLATLINFSQQGQGVDCSRQGPSLATSTILDKLDRNRQPLNAAIFNCTVQSNPISAPHSDLVGVEPSSSAISESVGAHPLETPQVPP